MEIERTAPGTWRVNGDWVEAPMGLAVTRIAIVNDAGEIKSPVANARFIVLADHHFDALVEALEMVMNHADAFECFRDDIGQAVKEQADNLLAKIRSEQSQGEKG